MPTTMHPPPNSGIYTTLSSIPESAAGKMVDMHLTSDVRILGRDIKEVENTGSHTK
jgi:hypothetical protein